MISISSKALSPYSSYPKQDALIQETSRFLGFKDSVAHYACVNRQHRDHFKSTGFPTQAVTIPARLLKELFQNIQQFPKLLSLHVKGTDYEDFVLTKRVSKIEELTFEKRTGFKIAEHHFIRLLEAIPDIKKLRFIGIGMGELQFEERLGQSLTMAACRNLHLLKELDLSNFPISFEGILQLLQSSQHFESVDLFGQTALDEMFYELIKSPHLKMLDFSGSNHAADYSILANCHSLEFFRPGFQITAEALLAIIVANPKLNRLDLRYCGSATSDIVLTTIATNLSELRVLHLTDTPSINKALFPELIQKCKHLQSFTLGGYTLDGMQKITDVLTNVTIIEK